MPPCQLQEGQFNGYNRFFNQDQEEKNRKIWAFSSPFGGAFGRRLIFEEKQSSFKALASFIQGEVLLTHFSPSWRLGFLEDSSFCLNAQHLFFSYPILQWLCVSYSARLGL
jgi:hypothetical protein